MAKTKARSMHSENTEGSSTRVSFESQFQKATSE